MSSIWTFHSAGELVFGRGAIARLGEHARRRGWRRLLVITDRRLEAAGVVEQALAPLRASGAHLEVWNEGEPEPTLAAAAAAIAAARARPPEALLGLGGGSNMDLAKIVAAALAHGGGPADYFGFDNVPGPVTPLVCVPTTAGTGSEVSHAAVLTDSQRRIKVSTLSNHLRPALAVVDPALTKTCPRQVTADSGVDALTHAIEAYTAASAEEVFRATGGHSAYAGNHPAGDCLAEKAIALVAEHLPTAVREPGNTAARDGMALAATLAGLAFSNCGVALVHGLEYPLGGELHCSHGAGNGLLLPHVMRFNLPARAERLAKVAALLGADTTGKDAAAAAELAIERVRQLLVEVGIPPRIRDLGGKPEQLAAFAAKTFAIKRLLQLNPRPATEADLLAILQAAY